MSLLEVTGSCFGRYGTCRMNSSGQLLLELRTEFQLHTASKPILNEGEQITTWIYSVSRQRYRLDYATGRKCYMQDVYTEKSLQRAKCWTDHKLYVPKCIFPLNRLLEFALLRSYRSSWILQISMPNWNIEIIPLTGIGKLMIKSTMRQIILWNLFQLKVVIGFMKTSKSLKIFSKKKKKEE